jgi:SAM-dependent methyltransferase
MKNETAISLLVKEFDTGTVYNSISGLRQAQDISWIIELLPNHNFATALDIGCGSGKFIAEFAKRNNLKQVVGIDQSQSMIDTARKNVRTIDNIVFDFHAVDILSNPKDIDIFDIVTMMSVLHWLYPYEKNVLKWGREHTNPNGVFCFTIYQPLDIINGYGGTDYLVVDALKKLGLSQTFPPQIIPIGTRTRTLEYFKYIIESYFFLERIEIRNATMKVNSQDEYIRYHLATFGNYYLDIVPKNRQIEFLQSLGEIAMERMKSLGFVTKMNVAAFLCRPK